MKQCVKARWAICVIFAALLRAAISMAASSGAEQARLVYLQIVPRQFTLNAADVPADIRAALKRPAAKRTTDSHGVVWQASGHGLIRRDSAGAPALLTGRDGLPILAITGVASGPDGWLWLATEEGAICFRPDAPKRERWFYFWGRRYLPDNDVESIVAARRAAWIRTRSGTAHIEFEPYTLERKADLLERRIRLRHDRYGYVSYSELPQPGNVSSNRPYPSDNDGLWTSLYVDAECFRYAVTHSPEALANARKSLAALERLVTITGIPGFPARAIIHRGDYRHPGGEWHWTPDGQWEWKGDTSNDELVGHFMAYELAYDLLADKSGRAAIRPVVASIAGGLLDHGLKLAGFGGRVTTWGDYSPEYFASLRGGDERALGSLELLSHLRVAWHVTGEDRFRKAYFHVANDLGYVQNLMQATRESYPARPNYSDEELAFLSFYPLLRLEDIPQLRGQYQTALRFLWSNVRDEQNPLWDLIYLAETESKDPRLQQAAIEALEGIPLSTISWTVKNAQRADLTVSPAPGRHGEKEATLAIPPNERRVMKWNSSPFQLDGGEGGTSEDDGAFFLLPYWLGRYYGLIPR